MALHLIRNLLVLILIMATPWAQSISLKDFFTVEKLKFLNYLDVTKTPTENGWLRSVTVKIPTQLDIAGLATSQIPFLSLNTNKNSQVTFVSWHPTEKEADSLLSFVDYLNKIPYEANQILEHFNVNEEIRFKTQLSILTGLNAVPKLIVTPMALEGANIISGEFDVYLKKISSTEVELSFTNTNNQEKGINGNIGTNTNLKIINIDSHLNFSLKKFFPRFLDFSNTTGETLSRTLSFKVDLGTPQGKDFYHKLLSSALLTEELKSIIDKNNYSLAEIKSQFIDPYNLPEEGITPLQFGSLKSTEQNQKFSFGWIFNNLTTQSFRRLWYQLNDARAQKHYYLVDDFKLQKRKKQFLGLGTELNESQTGKAFYLANEMGAPVKLIELVLTSNLDLKTKNSLKYIEKWQEKLRNNFDISEISQALEILKIVTTQKQDLKGQIAFSINHTYFKTVANNYDYSLPKTNIIEKMNTRLNSYLDNLPILPIFTASSCVGKLCNLFKKDKFKNSELYQEEIKSLTELFYELSHPKTDVNKQVKLIALLRKNPLFIELPIGIISQFIPEKDLAQVLSYEITTKNESTKERQQVVHRYSQNPKISKVLETIQYLQGEILKPAVFNRCLLNY